MAFIFEEFKKSIKLDGYVYVACFHHFQIIPIWIKSSLKKMVKERERNDEFSIVYIPVY